MIPARAGCFFFFLVSRDLTLTPVACQRRALMFGGQL